VSGRVHLSIVSPVYKAKECLPELHRRISAAAATISTDFEIILVDDASPDDSWSGIEELAKNDPKVRGFQLTRNFGQHHAITAGLSEARGDWVVVMDCDLQDPPEAIPRFYEKATREGHHCVLGLRKQRKDSLWKRMQSRAFYKIFSFLTEIEYDERVSNFGIASRQVVNEINGMGESVRYYPGFLFWLGYPTAFVDVAHEERFAGKSSYTFLKLLRHSQNIILAHSTKPLRLAVGFGLTLSIGAFLAGIIYFLYVVRFGSQVMGWPSLMITLMFSTGAIILTLGILGLYIGRIFIEVKRRPLYAVRKRTDA
jgi:polyisoprenyl-phosphate glycosyltransferase